MPKNIPAESLPTTEEIAQSFTEGLVERCKNMMGAIGVKIWIFMCSFKKRKELSL